MFNAYFTTERIMRKKTGLRGLCIFFVCQYIDFNKIFPTASLAQAITTLWLTGLSIFNYFNWLQKSRD